MASSSNPFAPIIEKYLITIGFAFLFSIHGFAQSLPANPEKTREATATTLEKAPSGEIRKDLEDEVDLPEPVVIGDQGTEIQATKGQEGSGKEARPNSSAMATRESEPVDPLTEFQQHVFQTTGRRIEVFGTRLFQRSRTPFVPVDQVPVPSDYVVGPGDELLLRAWGQIEINHRAIVDRNGEIYIPKVGTVRVAGIKFQDLRPYVQSQIERMFQGFTLDVSIGKLKSIPVFVVGYVRNPGSYMISSFSTLVNALFLSGGPSKRGSMRSIKVMRGKVTVIEFDLYDMLLKGDKSKDVALMSGDVIYVPPVGPSVALLGSVNDQAIYELKSKTTLDELLGYAGGITPNALGTNVAIERIEGQVTRRVVEVDLKKDGLSQELQNGDVIFVRSLPGRFANAITLKGNVENPGRYPWVSGMKINDLIPARESLVTRRFWDNQISSIKNENRKTEFPNLSSTVSPRAAPPSSVQQIIARGGPEINWEYAVVQRFNPDDLTTRLLPFNLGNAIQGTEPDNLALQPNDIVTIFSHDDIQIPILKRTKFIRLEGEFEAAGIYEALPGETLKKLLHRIQGILTPSAYLFGAEFSRISTQREQQKRQLEFIQRFEIEIERAGSSRLQTVVNSDDAVALREQLDAQRRVAQKLRQVEVTGRIILGLHPNDQSLDALADISLEDGDRLYIPDRGQVVNVLGAVYSSSSFLFKPAKSYSHYLKLAGGGTRAADMKRAFIIRADGSTIGRQQGSGWFDAGFGSIKIMPGDTIVIPERLDRVGFLRGLRDWTQVFGQLALGAAAIRTLTN